MRSGMPRSNACGAHPLAHFSPGGMPFYRMLFSLLRGTSLDTPSPTSNAQRGSVCHQHGGGGAGQSGQPGGTAPVRSLKSGRAEYKGGTPRSKHSLRSRVNSWVQSPPPSNTHKTPTPTSSHRTPCAHPSPPRPTLPTSWYTAWQRSHMPEMNHSRSRVPRRSSSVIMKVYSCPAIAGSDGQHQAVSAFRREPHVPDVPRGHCSRIMRGVLRLCSPYLSVWPPPKAYSFPCHIHTQCSHF
jgi:hypothetical protein